MVAELPPLALYVHIPWCERKCPYCDFNSHEGFDLSLEAGYVETLLADLDTQLPFVQGREIASVFFGGGTPSLFSPNAIGRLLDGIAARVTLTQDVEVTLESNPGSAEADRYRGYFLAGVNRLSIGVQSFSDAALQQLGRVHDRAAALRAIDFAGRAGFSRYNIDLMHGLPGQSVAEARADLEQALAIHGGHISWYQLTIETNTAFYRDPPVLPVDDTLADIQEAGEAQLAAQGFTNYEVSAFAQPGEACRHNLNYWQFGDYLAIGAGAHGKVTRNRQVSRFRRTRAPRDYQRLMAAPSPPHTTSLSTDLLTGEFMLNSLRLRAGVSRDVFEQRTYLDWSVVAPTVAQCVDQGLLIDDADMLCTTALGYRFLNDVVGRFFPD